MGLFGECGRIKEADFGHLYASVKHHLIEGAYKNAL